MSILMLTCKRAPNAIGRVGSNCPSRSKPTLPLPSTKPQPPTLARLLG